MSRVENTLTNVANKGQQQQPSPQEQLDQLKSINAALNASPRTLPPNQTGDGGSIDPLAMEQNYDPTNLNQMLGETLQ